MKRMGIVENTGRHIKAVRNWLGDATMHLKRGKVALTARDVDRACSILEALNGLLRKHLEKKG